MKLVTRKMINGPWRFKNILRNKCLFLHLMDHVTVPFLVTVIMYEALDKVVITLGGYFMCICSFFKLKTNRCILWILILLEIRLSSNSASFGGFFRQRTADNECSNVALEEEIAFEVSVTPQRCSDAVKNMKRSIVNNSLVIWHCYLRK